MKRLLVAALFLTLASLSLDAQETTADHKAMKPQPAKPSPEITRLLKIFSGTWTTSEKIEAGPMAPTGGTGHGTATFKAGPGGNSMIEEYSSPHGAVGPFHGLGITWWDEKAGAFKGTWCDSMTQTCMVGGMRWQGDKIVGLPQTMDMGDKQMVMTSEYRDIKPQSITYTMGMGPTAEQARTTMTIVYTKAGRSAAPASRKGTAAKK